MTWDDVGNFFKGVGNSIVGVGKSVLDTVVDLGKGAADLVVHLPQHICDAVSNGTSRIAEGVDQMKNGAGFAGLANVLGGVINTVTPLGVIGDTVSDVALQNTELVEDELGNSKYVDKEGASTGIISSLAKSFINSDRRQQQAIKDAIAEGDAGKANLAMLGEWGSVGMGALSQATSVASIVCTATGVGAPVGIALSGASLGLNMGSRALDSALETDDLKNDVSSAVSKDIEKLKDEGRLTDENEDEYEQYLTSFYNATSVNGAGQVGALSKEDFEAAAVGNGLLLAPSGYTSLEDYDQSASFDPAYQKYIDLYQPYIDDGSYTADQVDRLAMMSVMHDNEEIDDETFYMNLHMVQYENYDLTTQQAMTLATLDAYKDMGAITQNEYVQVIQAEPVFDNLWDESKTNFFIPMKQDVQDRVLEKNGVENNGLLGSIVDKDAFENNSVVQNLSQIGQSVADYAAQKDADENSFSFA